MVGLTLGALGVVSGDIGTSPLYALQAVFTADGHAIRPTPGRAERGALLLSAEMPGGEYLPGHGRGSPGSVRSAAERKL